MVFDDDKDTFYNPMIDTTLAKCVDYVPWSRDLDTRALTDKEVLLPGSTIDLPRWKYGAHVNSHYRYFEEWQALVRAIASLKHCSILQLELVNPASTANAGTSVAGTASCNTGASAASNSATKTAPANTSVKGTSALCTLASGVSVSVIHAPFGFS